MDLIGDRQPGPQAPCSQGRAERAAVPTCALVAQQQSIPAAARMEGRQPLLRIPLHQLQIESCRRRQPLAGD